MNNKKNVPPYGVPRNARRVFTGVLWDTYQWQQKVFDGSTKTFECLKRVNTAIIIPVVGDAILIQHQLQPHWDRELASLPAGRCDGEEKPLLCAKRELLEETGYASDDWELLYSEHPYRLIIWEVFVFVARNCKKVAAQNLDAGEKISVECVSLDTLLKYVDHPDWRAASTDKLMYQCRLYPEKRRALEKKLFGKTAR